MIDYLTYDEFWPLYLSDIKDKQQCIRIQHYINNGWGCPPLSYYPSAKITYSVVKGNDIAIIPPPRESEILHDIVVSIDHNPNIDCVDIDCVNIDCVDTHVTNKYIDDNESDNYNDDNGGQDPHQRVKDRLGDRFIIQFYSEYIEKILTNVPVHRNLCYPLSYYRYIDYNYIDGIDKNQQAIRCEYFNFPLNISHIISMKKSKKGGKYWLILGQISDNTGKYFFFKASSREDGFEAGGVISLYICDDYNLLISMAINNKEKYSLGLILTEKKKKLAKMVYYKFVELLSKPPHGYYFLKDIQQQLLDSNSPHHEQFKVWVSNRNYNSIDKFLSS